MKHLCLFWQQILNTILYSQAQFFIHKTIILYSQAQFFIHKTTIIYNYS